MGLTVGIFHISAFSIVLCLFSLHLNEILPITHSFLRKNIAKHCLTAVQ